MASNFETNVKKHSISILGSNYIILSDEEELDITRSALLVDSTMKDIAAKSKINDIQKISILSNIQLANNIKKNQDLNNKIEIKINDLINIIEKSITDQSI
jgi:cell division protein ZapA (FtsZ GTPase activity inhibitor)